MTPLAPECIRTIHGLSEQMDEALLEGAIESFIEISDERSRALRAFFQDEANSGHFDETIASVIRQDRVWIDRLRELLDEKRQEIDGVRRRRQDTRQIYKAYDRYGSKGKLLVRNG